MPDEENCAITFACGGDEAVGVCDGKRHTYRIWIDEL